MSLRTPAAKVRPREVAHLLAGLLPDGVLCDVAEIGVDYSDLRAAEAKLVERAVPKRRREFATGRRLARALMAELGESPAPLLAREDRTPRWPDPLVGSITHDDQLCAVAVARREDFASLGIDLEPAQALPSELWESVCGARERAWIAGVSPPGGLMARLHFSAKEAVYKGQYPLTRRMLDFSDLELEIDLSRGIFHAELQADLSPHFPRGHRFRGNWAIGATHILCAATVTSDKKGV